MKSDIILSGVGGQGILSIAAVIGQAAVSAGLHMKQSEVHGMSQRGGDVQSHLRISDKEVFSDLVPHGGADMILSVEPMESLRYLPWLSKQGWIITNSQPFINIPNYPDQKAVIAEIEKQPKHIIINADELAKAAGNSRGMNMVMAGAASLFIDIPQEKMEGAIQFLFGRKGEEIVKSNIAAFRAGREFAQKKRG
ncbi:MAG TPA: indolepyruvate oxidoreductase subunit beta [bacterium]|nr:indolepyruvate oxidoreductase subunit beta [bacterium]